MLDKRNRTQIIIDYYEGAYGPTIRIDVQSVESLTRLKDLFSRLASSASMAIDLAEIKGARAIGLSKLMLKVAVVGNKSEKKLELLAGAEIIFEWCMSSTEWKKAEGLIDGLLEYNQPGHQYLTEEGVDDAIVELAFKE